MTTEIKVQMTPQGLRIPRAALEDWQDAELEIVQEKHCVMIRPKSTVLTEHERAREVLREAGLLYETNWETPPVVSPEELARLAEKLAQGQPLSELIIAERELIIQALREDGLLAEVKKPAIQPPVSEEERAALAKKLSVGRPLSEIIIEEREALIHPKSTLPTAPTILHDAGTLYETNAPVTVQITSEGLFVPHALIQDWEEVEVITEAQRIIIQPKVTPSAENQQILHLLESCGFQLSAEILPTDYQPLSPEEQVELIQAFSVGKPLSTMIVEERAER